MPTYYQFITVHSGAEIGIFLINEEHMDPSTIEWVKRTGKIPVCDDAEGEDLDEIKSEDGYVPIPVKHIIEVDTSDSARTNSKSAVSLGCADRLITICTMSQFE